MPPFHVRCVKSLSLTYHNIATPASSGSGRSTSSFVPPSPIVDLEASPELQGLHAVLLLGSSDISEDERSIYDAFVKSRNKEEMVARTESNNNDSADTKKSKCSTLLMCADGAVASKAAGNTAIAFDAVCGDFDSIPPELLSLLVNNETTPSGGPIAEFYHVTALYKKDCRFVPDPRMRIRLPPNYFDTLVPDASLSLSDALQRRQEALGQKTEARRTSNSASQQPLGTQAPSLVVKVDCQMTTDFEKCCQLLEIHHNVSTRSQSQVTSDSEGGEKEGDGDEFLSVAPPLPKVLVLGALGGRLDHEFAVFNTLFQFVNRLDLLIFNGKNSIFAIKPNSLVSFTRDPSIDGHTVGVVAFGPPTNGIITKGLKWELGPELMVGFGHIQSTSNKIVGIRIVDDDDERSSETQDGGEGAEGQNGSQMNEGNSNEAASVKLNDPLVAPLIAPNNRVGKSVTKEELRYTFIVDTRGVPTGTYVLVTVPREDKKKSAPPSPKL